MRVARVGVALVAVVLSSGCRSGPSGAAVNRPAPLEGKSVASPASCHYRSTRLGSLFVLPDPHCTPGALNVAVTQATIRSTICKAGWTATIRPPVEVTRRIKSASTRAYGLQPASVRGTELDHLVPLELGGAPSDPGNLWVQPNYPGAPHPTSYDHNPKDATEFALRNAVCAGRLPLVVAQRAIRVDWTTAGALVRGARP